jgi:chemosensory pili system protein ChpA (sensor histidine kinase/response regulator)
LSIVGSDRDQHIDDAIAHAVSAGSDVDDDIDAIDVIDPDLFPIFEEEAAELLPQLGGALRQWASRPDNLGARNEVLRALHTLKGSSRLAGAMRLGEMSHRLESAIEQLDMETVTADQIEPLLASFPKCRAQQLRRRCLHPHQRFGFPGLRSWRLCVWPRTSRCACVRSCWTVW